MIYMLAAGSVLLSLLALILKTEWRRVALGQMAVSVLYLLVFLWLNLSGRIRDWSIR